MGCMLTTQTLSAVGLFNLRGGWSLGGEDPKYYTKAKLWDARREWPDVPYPTAAASSSEPIPVDEEDTPTHTREELKELLSIHHTFTKFILKMGVDPCKAFEEDKVENILLGIKSSDLECKICGKIYSNSMRMKRHVKKRHLGKTDWQCDICKKYYMDASSLKEHKGNHDTNLRPHGCPKCPKRFATDYKLTEHLLMHQGKTFICSFEKCGKVFTYKRGKEDHLPKCKENPNRPKEAPFKCELCGRGYWDNRSLLRHKREKH